MQHSYPVGKAQGMVLMALGRKDIDTYQEAEAFFASVGISVIAVRQGRASVPSITVQSGHSWNVGGDADTWGGTTLTSEQKKAIAQWMSR